MKDGAPSGPWEVFADGFAGTDTIDNTSDADYRPMGLAMGPEGSLYISDSEKGKIWRIMFKGEREKFGEAQLANMEKRKAEAPNVRKPDEINDILIPKGDGKSYWDRNLSKDTKLFNTYCAICHQRNGEGNDRFPPLNGSEWVIGDKERLIGIILNGLQGEIMVKGKSYNNVMPKLDMLKDTEIAEILTYIRQNFGNDASAVEPSEVAKARKANKKDGN
jgi:hypothetical protein